MVEYAEPMPILLNDLDLRKAERMLVELALARGGSIVKAAEHLGITRHALKRRIIKFQIQWPPANPATASASQSRELGTSTAEQMRNPESR